MASMIAVVIVLFCSITYCSCRPISATLDEGLPSSSLEASPMSKRTPVTFLSQDYGRRIAAADQEIQDLLQVYTKLVKSTVGKERPSDEWIPISRLIRAED